MLLCVDIGNTNIVLGLHDGESWQAHWRVRTARASMPDEYAVLLRGLLRDGGYRTDDISQVILASVVPPLTSTFTELFERYLASDTLVVGPGVRSGLREAMEGRTTLIIAHRLSTIALADELVVLDNGEIAARGTHDELLASSDVYREIYEHGLLEREFAERVEARA